MPAKVKVRILAGRNLPVMDRTSDTSDAYVEVKLGNTTFKTEVCRRSLNPQWNSEWFRFEVDDEELQDEPLQIRIMDYDTYSANDAIGKVYVNLNPLLYKQLGFLSGWYPIYDTMHGIRGEINMAVKVDLFSDTNKYRESSCGVHFFYSPRIPHGYQAQVILGFVEELVVNDDPEYQWIDKIRTPRASNETRQTLFSKLSGEVQRKIGLKALELGGNAVVGYQQCFDLEGESGIVVRGIGTAMNLVKLSEGNPATVSPPREGTRESPVPEDTVNALAPGPSSPTTVTVMKLSQSPAKVNLTCGQRRSSESDLSTTPKANSLGDSSGSGSGGTRTAVHRPAIGQDSLDMLEYPFITIKQIPPGFVQHIGGVVSARSVKLLVQINNPDEPETRDAWWTELRKEVRSHTRALGCNIVLGYCESAEIYDEVCVLSASGTAAVLNTNMSNEHDGTSTLGYTLNPRPCTVATTQRDWEKERETAKDKEKPLKVDINLANQVRLSHNGDWNEDSVSHAACSLCHIPYSESSIPFPVNLMRCSVCRRHKVPDILLMTIEPPNVPVCGKGCLIQARVCRVKKDGSAEQNAKEISDSLPFLEYELHRQLVNKLKVKGMNGIFGLKVQVSVGEKMLVGVATGTGAYLTALPAPVIPKIISGKGTESTKLHEVQMMVQEAVQRNREAYDIKSHTIDPVPESHMNGKSDDAESSDDDQSEVDLSTGNKEACVLEVDDAEDINSIALLIDSKTPEGFDVSSIEILPGRDNFVCNLQMFSRVYRIRLPFTEQNSLRFSLHFERIIQGLFVKLQRLVPCCLTNLNFHVDLPEEDEMQISVLGVAIGLGHPYLLTTVGQPLGSRTKSKKDSELDMIFSMDEDRASSEITSASGLKQQSSHRSSELKFIYHRPPREYHGIDMTPLSSIPGGRIERYMGNLDFFFIRETTSIREEGGLNGFMHRFLSEVFAIVRAHVAALGGNALVAYHMNHCVLLYNPHKNQAQCLVDVGGDAVLVQYHSSEHTSGDVSTRSTMTSLVAASDSSA
ncbi:C2 domain-containing protein 5 isoform X3 [Tachypleus tridentatus]|uniref:C2 domain-containing protein 5 isoform X3 n=1 Tax=Tachypleus tridentatus TaxID=6853 RepID=UPI003FD229FA